jgi:raffinose/stachyose/melibiose transport system permease protein
MTQSTPISSPTSRSDVPTISIPYQPARRTRLEVLGRWSFIIPILLLNLIVIVIPTIYSIYIAFTDWSGYGQPVFNGLANFQELFQDRIFFKALGNNLIWTGLFLTVPVTMGLTGAYLLAGIKRTQVFYRLAFFIPYVISSVVNTQIWRFILNPRAGIGSWLAERGITFLDFPLLGTKDTALYAIAFVDNWHFWGFLVVIYLAAMSAVDTELYEVARLDGATRFQQFRFITLPSIRPTLVFTILMIIIWSSLVFDYVYILTGGGPAHGSEVMATYLYDQAFARFEVGYSASIGIMMSIWVMITVSIFVILRRRGWEI